MNRLNTILEKHSSPVKVLVAFGFFILFFLIFRILTPEFKILSGGYDIPDVSLVFSVLSPYELFAQYGEQGRNYYNYIQVVDLFYPTVYCIFFTLLLSGINSTFIRSKWPVWLNLLPLIASLFDYGENISLLIMNQLFPGEFGIIASIGYLLSFGKWIFFTAMVFVSLVYLVIFVCHKKNKRLPSQS